MQKHIYREKNAHYLNLNGKRSCLSTQIGNNDSDLILSHNNISSNNSFDFRNLFTDSQSGKLGCNSIFTISLINQ